MLARFTSRRGGPLAALAALCVLLPAAPAPAQITPPPDGGIAGTVRLIGPDDPNGGIFGGFVQVCMEHPTLPQCKIAATNPNGTYAVGGLDVGVYTVTAWPRPGVLALPASITARIEVAHTTVFGQDINVTLPRRAPEGTSIAPATVNQLGILEAQLRSPLTLRTRGCPNGAATWTLFQRGVPVASGTLTENPLGTYTASIQRPPVPGALMSVQITIDCPIGPDETTVFDFTYHDPSGQVRTTTGQPLRNATVTLLHATSATGAFTPVPDGDVIMSPANRRNPDLTDASGLYAWDVLAGFYKVRVEKQGCVDPDDPQATYVESGVLTVPPPVVDLDFVLDCSTPTSTSDKADVIGIVPSHLILELCGKAYFGYFLPGVTREYRASTCALATSSAGDATLSVSDESTTPTGRMANGVHVLPAPLLTRASTIGVPAGPFSPIGPAASPLTLLTWTGPFGEAPITLDFAQFIAKTDNLRAGVYRKTLTFTLSTTQP